MIPTINQQVADRLNELEIPCNAFDTAQLRRELKLWQQGKRLLFVKRYDTAGLIAFLKLKKKPKA